MELNDYLTVAAEEGIELSDEDISRTRTFLLTSKIQEKARGDRNSKYVRWGVPTLVALLSASGYGGWKLVQVDPNEMNSATVTKEVGDLDTQVHTNSAKIELLGELAVEQQELTVETAQFIGKKIDAAHPDTANAVEKPKPLQDAEDAANTRARKAKAGELFKDIKVEK